MTDAPKTPGKTIDRPWRVYVVASPGENGESQFDVYTRAAALKLARAAVPEGVTDTRTDSEALFDFQVVHMPSIGEFHQ